MGLRAVTFDLDDTLAVVDRPRAELLADAITAVGAPPISRAAYLDAHARVWSSRTREPIFSRLLETAGDTDVDPAALATAYRNLIGEHLRPVNGVEAMLDILSAEVPVGLVTNGPERAQLDKLERLGWTDRFDATVISGRLGTPKPQSAPFMAACDRLGVDPGDVLHFGDHPTHDVRGSRDAGLKAVQVVSPGVQRAEGVRTIHRHRLAAEAPGFAHPAVH